MKGAKAVWLNTISALALLSILGFYFSDILAQFFAALSNETRSETDAALRVFSRALGTSLFVLLGTGAILVPGELTGLIPFHPRSGSDYKETKLLTLTILLASMSLLSVVALFSLVAVASRLIS